MELYIIILLVILHYIGDFLLQTDNMAINKSSSNKWLFYHVVTYSIPFVLINPVYAALNGLLHWFTDYYTSRIAKHYYTNNNRSMFFKVIGLDQTIHIVTLVSTYVLFKEIYYEYPISWLL